MVKKINKACATRYLNNKQFREVTDVQTKKDYITRLMMCPPKQALFTVKAGNKMLTLCLNARKVSEKVMVNYRVRVGIGWYGCICWCVCVRVCVSYMHGVAGGYNDS